LSFFVRIFPITNENRTFGEFNSTFALISANGNISTINNNVIVHIHAALSDKTTNIFGGYLIETSVLSTAEILIINTGAIARNMNNTTRDYELSF
jgi:predicted DNA-binding protein with PD1-like motif